MKILIFPVLLVAPVFGASQWAEDQFSFCILMIFRKTGRNIMPHLDFLQLFAFK